MFQIGFVELVILVIVVIVFLKPEDLPAFFRKIGRVLGELKSFTRAFKWKMTEMEIEENRKKKEAANQKSSDSDIIENNEASADKKE
ncbi:MAG: hypothetical protein JXR70_15195 [Spirochaetales bacterium]|nr:hypothetical protein [Spirochaetales bacterium]